MTRVKESAISLLFVIPDGSIFQRKRTITVWNVDLRRRFDLNLFFDPEEPSKAVNLGARGLDRKNTVHRLHPR